MNTVSSTAFENGREAYEALKTYQLGNTVSRKRAILHKIIKLKQGNDSVDNSLRKPMLSRRI